MLSKIIGVDLKTYWLVQIHCWTMFVGYVKNLLLKELTLLKWSNFYKSVYGADRFKQIFPDFMSPVIQKLSCFLLQDDSVYSKQGLLGVSTAQNMPPLSAWMSKPHFCIYSHIFWWKSCFMALCVQVWYCVYILFQSPPPDSTNKVRFRTF